jgi:uncharacterized membrane-anchored protein YhcB (DUF1043 family)
MNEWILFTIGIFIGGMLGIMIMALVSANRFSNMSGEIQDLRTQRLLLKEELLRRKPSKPKPRKYRGKRKNVRPR